MYRSNLMMCVLLAVTGCSSNPIDSDPNYKLYLQSISALANAEANKANEPLLLIEAQPGQDIKFQGVKTLRVYAPQQSNGANYAGLGSIRPYSPPRSQVLDVVDKALSTVGVPLALAYSNKLTIREVGAAATAGYRYVQAPQANQTISGSGVIGNGSYTNETNTLSGTGVVGAGTYTTETLTLSGTGTLGSGAYTENTLSGTGVINGNYTPTTNEGDVVGP